LKHLAKKKPAKDQREQLLLFGLVELYIKTGRPVGSHTLKECGFESLSSATIRNYFVKLEQQGFLKQQHSSGGRVPTPEAYKAYASHVLHQGHLSDKEKVYLHKALEKETREVAGYLQDAIETLSEASGCAIFLSAPRFDHDFILDVKLISLDHRRCLCVLLTDFGQVHTQILHAGKKLGSSTLKKIESYFHWKLTNLDKPRLTEEELEMATRFYNEVILRHIVGSSHFTTEDIIKTGVSKLLRTSDLAEPSALASILSLFENTTYLRSLLRECSKLGQLRLWIGDDLRSSSLTNCSVLAIPYRIHQTIVGALGILGPNRIPYRKMLGILELASEKISAALTNSLYKFKITYRSPQENPCDKLEEAPYMLLEDKQDGE
jgi:heat-inducible transcriptional repressor